MTSPEDLRHWLRRGHAPDWVNLADISKQCMRCIRPPKRRKPRLVLAPQPARLGL